MRRSLTIRCRVIRAAADAGMTTAEYAVGTLAACQQHTSPSPWSAPTTTLTDLPIFRPNLPVPRGRFEPNPCD
ncbi:MAG: DUF4244 domain-containing protein [Dermatophilaceae bacterium]